MADEGDVAQAAVPQVIKIPTNIPLPPKLDLKGDLSRNFRKFKRMWENYELASRCKDDPDDCRSATLLTCIGSDALDILDGLQFEQEEDKMKVEKILEKFELYCIGETNETWERYTFNKRDQEQFESIDSYVTILRTLAKTCNYGNLEESLIRDRIVIGIKDNSIRKRLLQNSKLTLKDCVDICRAHENASRRLKSMATEEVQAIHRGKPVGKPKKWTSDKKSTRPQVQQQQQQTTALKCKFCGKHHEFGKKLCPAWGKVCSSCHGTNHFSTMCPKRGTVHSKVNLMDEQPDEEYILTVSENCDSETVNSVQTENVEMVNTYPKRIFAKMTLNGQEVNFQLDCGSTVNILPQKLYSEVFDDLELVKLDKGVTTTLRMFNGSETVPVGKRRVSIFNPKNERRYSIEFLVAGGEACNPILGSRAIQQMNLVTVNFENILMLTSAGTETDVDSLQLTDIHEKYADLFTGEGKIDGMLHLEVDSTVQPVQLPRRKIPVSLQESLKTELQRLTEMNIITPVEVPTDWISALVVVKKPGTDKLRICIDPKPLNCALKRNHYPTVTIEDVLPDLSKAKCFSLVDAKNGFWHIQLDEKSSLLTTFDTPWGRYRWLRLPFGLSPAPEEFQRRLDNAISGLNGVKAVHDDILVYGIGESYDEAERDHDLKMIALLDRCRQKNIKLNKSKLKLKLPEVPYLGHRLTADGLKIDPSKVDAIKMMPAPVDKHGVQRLLGMVNFVQKFAPNISEVTAPLRDLLKDDTKFHWNEDVQGKCLEKVKDILSSPPVLKYFDNDAETTIQCDASQSGLGACLIQEGQPVAYASRSMTSTEQNYAQIEKETLAIVFAMERFEQYVYGRKVMVESDHKPLETILRKSLLSAPKRLQRMMLRLQKYEFEVIYKRGSQMFLADTLSRAYLPHVQEIQDDDGHVLSIDIRSPTEVETESVNMVDYLAISDERISEIQKATDEDDSMTTLKNLIQSGWPDTESATPYCTRDYFPFRDELSVQNGIIYKGERVVIPLRIRPHILDRIHSSHIGVQGCIRRAREHVYWPKMTKDVTEYVGKCDTCNTLQQSQRKEPLISHEVPTRPWSKLGSDLFEFDQKDYIITVDYYSDYFEIDRLHDKRAPEIIKKLKSHMARHGLPNEVVTDNGPPFNSELFQRFSEQYDFKHVTSSPRYPQSNGKVESVVKTAKRLLAKSLHSETDPHLALLDWRNTPTEKIGSSPSQRLFGRRTRTLLPTTSKLLEPEIVRDVPEKLAGRKQKQAFYYNRNAAELSKLKEGDVVRIKPTANDKRWQKAVVNQEAGIRSYNLTTEGGSNLRRNRRHLRLSHEKPPDLPADVQLPDMSDQQDIDITVPVNPVIPSSPKPTTSRSNATLSPPRPAPVVPRRTSGRQVNLPNRYKDFVLTK